VVLSQVAVSQHAKASRVKADGSGRSRHGSSRRFQWTRQAFRIKMAPTPMSVHNPAGSKCAEFSRIQMKAEAALAEAAIFGTSILCLPITL
jgi:hypothetical protein